MGAGRVPGSRRRKKPNQRGGTPTAEATRVVQGRCITLSGSKGHAKVKGRQAQDNTHKRKA